MATITGNSFSNTLNGTADADTITGLGGNDRLTGYAGDDLLDGGTGNDTLDGGDGNDSLLGGDGTDSILGGTGNDTIEGGAGNDTIRAGAGDDVWFAGDSLSGTDLVYLEDGNDLAYVGWFTAGSPDTIDGGTGNDTISLQSIPDTTDFGITLNDDGTSTTILFGTVVNNFENVIGNGANNALTGNSAANSLSGLAGNDTLVGNAGNDTLDGGTGADSLSGGADNDTLIGGDGNDTLDGGTGNDWLTGDTGADSLLGGDGNDTLLGGADNDTLSGDAGNDTLSGGTGNDALYGGTGNDTLAGGAGADILSGGSGMDYADYTASGSGVSVNLAAGTGAGGDAAGDSLSGIDGIYGSAHDDTLIGFDGEVTSGTDAYTNVFYGGAGNDYMDGAGGSDSLYGDEGNDTILGGAGDDLVAGGTGNDSLDGGTGNDALDGGEGNDTLLGGAGDDALTGGAGNDLLYGGAGADTITGGAGSDTIVIYAGESAGDVIIGAEDADSSDYDVLELHGDYTVVRDPNDWESGTILWADGSTTSFQNIEKIIPCFTPGTLIETRRGPVAVEDLAPGDRVLTRDNGYQPIRWIGQRALGPADLVLRPQLQPVRIARGALSANEPEADLIVSPQHRMLLSGSRAELFFGEPEVLAAALHMVGRPGITRLTCARVTYLHLLFDSHEIIRANGAWTESYQPGKATLGAMSDPQRKEILDIFPELAEVEAENGWAAARLSLKAHEVRLMLAA